MYFAREREGKGSGEVGMVRRDEDDSRNDRGS